MTTDGTPSREWVYLYATATRRAVLRRFQRCESCIISARVGVAVARRFGLACQPLPVRLLIGTRDFFSSRGLTGTSVGTRATGAVNGDQWNGHLGVYLAGRWWVDLAADMYSHPEAGIVVDGPVVVEASPERLAAGAATPLGSELIYHVRAVDDQQWRRFPAWTSEPGPARAATADAVHALPNPTDNYRTNRREHAERGR